MVSAIISNVECATLFLAVHWYTSFKHVALESNVSGTKLPSARFCSCLLVGMELVDLARSVSLSSLCLVWQRGDWWRGVMHPEDYTVVFMEEVCLFSHSLTCCFGAQRVAFFLLLPSPFLPKRTFFFKAKCNGAVPALPRGALHGWALKCHLIFEIILNYINRSLHVVKK